MEDFDSYSRQLLSTLPEKGAEAVSEWAKTLRKKSSDKAIKEVQIFTENALKQSIQPEILFDTAECLRPNIHFIKLTTKDDLTDAEALEYLKLLDCEMQLYAKVASHDNATGFSIYPLALHRKLSCLINRQLIYYKHYLHIPEKEWLLIHAIFYSAVKNKLAGFSADDKIYFINRKLSILNLYAMSLLLGCGQMNHFTPTEITKVSRLLQDWSSLITISRKPAHDSDDQLVVDLTAGSAPRFKKLFHAGEKAITCYLQIDDLINKLDSMLPDSKTKALDQEDNSHPAEKTAISGPGIAEYIIAHLKKSWTQYSHRDERTQTNEVIKVCASFDSVFYYLAGNKTVKDFIGEKASLSIVYDEDEDRSTIEKERSSDVWSAFLSVPDGDLVSGDIPPEFNFQHYFPGPQPETEALEYPCHHPEMLDISIGGCRLRWPDENSPHIDVGSLIGMRRKESHGHWEVGEIVWKDHADDGTITTGVRLLSTKPIPVAVDIPLRLARNENYAGAILFPPEDSLETQQTIFALSPLKLKTGEYITISQIGIEEKIYLDAELKRNSSVECFYCSFVVGGKSLDISR